MHAKEDASLCLDPGVFFQPCSCGLWRRAKKQALECQGLGPGFHVQTRPEKATETCPKPKPQAASESEGVHC